MAIYNSSGYYAGLTTLVLIVSAISTALAEELDGSETWTTNLYFENDLFDETDQNYTNGVRVSWISPNLQHFENDERLPQWMRLANKRLRSIHNNDSLHRNLVFSIGQLIFTPQDKFASELIDDDRPYAGFLYTRLAYHMRTEQQLTSTSMTLGMVGPASLAEEAQDWIHDLRGIDKFNGWDNQLRNELVINFEYERKYKIELGRVLHGLEHDFIAHGGGAFGNQAIYLNAGGEYRIGWQLPNDFGTSSLRSGGDTSAPGPFDRRLKGEGFHSLHAFISFDGRLVGRDIFLDGNTFSSSHSVDRKNWVGDLAVGVSSTFNRYKVSYAQVFRTREFDEQDDAHRFGSLSFSYTW